MEKRSRLWIWILIGVLCLGAIGGGVWMGLNRPTVEELRSKGVFVLTKDDLEEEDMVEGTDILVKVERWSSDDLILGFSRGNRGGSFKVDFGKTRVVLKIPNPEGEGVVDHNLMSTLSPYWEKSFCLGDTLVFRLKDSAVELKESLGVIKSEDVVKITNLGPSKCRKGE